MTGLEVVAVGYLLAWGRRKAARVGAAVDAEVDRVLDAKLAELHRVVSDRLGADPALVNLESAATAEAVPDRVRLPAVWAITDAVNGSPDFKAELAAVVAAVQDAERAAGVSLIVGSNSGVVVGGNASVTASGGSVATLQAGNVSLGSSPTAEADGDNDPR